MEVGELHYGSPTVVHSEGHKLNISWFLKNIEMAIRYFTHILKRVGHFILT